jgi:hypothetical protein
VLPARSAVLALALRYFEVLRGMQNAESNALVAALIILAFAAAESEKRFRVTPNASDELSVELDLNVAFERG